MRSRYVLSLATVLDVANVLVRRGRDSPAARLTAWTASTHGNITPLWVSCKHMVEGVAFARVLAKLAEAARLVA
jgi:hypothetical protein